MKEADIARAIIDWLTEDGWEVYKEVCLDEWTLSPPRADIIAVRRPLIWIVETKKNMSLAVLDQAFRIFKDYPTHYLSIGVAAPRSARTHHEAAEEFLRLKGIGLFYVYGSFSSRLYCNCMIAPRLRRLKKCSVLDRLHEDQKTSVAGNDRNKYSTPFKRTIRRIERYLALQPDGATMKEILSNVPTHYSCETTAKTALAKHLQSGLVPGIRVDKTRRPYRYFIEENKRIEYGNNG